MALAHLRSIEPCHESSEICRQMSVDDQSTILPKYRSSVTPLYSYQKRTLRCEHKFNPDRFYRACKSRALENTVTSSEHFSNAT